MQRQRKSRSSMRTQKEIESMIDQDLKDLNCIAEDNSTLKQLYLDLQKEQQCLSYQKVIKIYKVLSEASENKANFMERKPFIQSFNYQNNEALKRMYWRLAEKVIANASHFMLNQSLLNLLGQSILELLKINQKFIGLSHQTQVCSITYFIEVIQSFLNENKRLETKIFEVLMEKGFISSINDFYNSLNRYEESDKSQTNLHQESMQAVVEKDFDNFITNMKNNSLRKNFRGKTKKQRYVLRKIKRGESVTTVEEVQETQQQVDQELNSELKRTLEEFIDQLTVNGLITDATHGQESCDSQRPRPRKPQRLATHLFKRVKGSQRLQNIIDRARNSRTNVGSKICSIIVQTIGKQGQRVSVLHSSLTLQKERFSCQAKLSNCREGHLMRLKPKITDDRNQGRFTINMPYVDDRICSQQSRFSTPIAIKKKYQDALRKVKHQINEDQPFSKSDILTEQDNFSISNQSHFSSSKEAETQHGQFQWAKNIRHTDCGKREIRFPCKIKTQEGNFGKLIKKLNSPQSSESNKGTIGQFFRNKGILLRHYATMEDRIKEGDQKHNINSLKLGTNLNKSRQTGSIFNKEKVLTEGNEFPHKYEIYDRRRRRILKRLSR